MSEPEKDILDDSTPSVHLTVGQLKALVREETQKALGQNGHQDGDRLLDAKSAAKRLCVPVSWIRDAARRGELPSIELGHYRRFRIEDLDRFIKDHKK